MAFCKICTCGEKIVFETRLGYPDNCPVCGRGLVNFQTYDEVNDAALIATMLVKEKEVTEANNTTNDGMALVTERKNKKYALRLNDGREIEIPEAGCIIGRTEVGAEELAEFPSVSRQHIRVTIKRNIGVLIEDISRYGTLVDGQRIGKNMLTRVAEGSKVTLCNVDAVLTTKEGNDI